MGAFRRCWESSKPLGFPVEITFRITSWSRNGKNSYFFKKYGKSLDGINT